mmetsp:Transcript_5462/g.18815  ORF Transcript_5462/g.18815 Transcript_5462/m.18815 type:complete len:236 (+) Transcript_5462:2146-2853(+)
MSNARAALCCLLLVCVGVKVAGQDPAPDLNTVELFTTTGTDLAAAMANLEVRFIKLHADVSVNGATLPMVTTEAGGVPRHLTIVGECGSTYSNYYGTNQRCTIDGDSLGRLFRVGASGTLSLENLLIRRGVSNAGGAAVAVVGGKLELRDVQLNQHTSGTRGGAISNVGGDVDIRDSSFSSNTATHAANNYWATTNSRLMVKNTQIDGADFVHLRGAGDETAYRKSRRRRSRRQR